MLTTLKLKLFYILNFSFERCIEVYNLSDQFIWSLVFLSSDYDMKKRALFLVAILVGMTTNDSLVFGEEERRAGRYLIVKTGPDTAEAEPLRAIKLIQIPSHINDVYGALEHLLRETGYTINPQSSEAKQIFSSLSLPAVHREMGPMTINEALHTLIGPTWSLTIDDQLRSILIDQHQTQVTNETQLKRRIGNNPNIGSLDEPIIAHFEQISFQDLIQKLVPDGWKISFELPPEKMTQHLAYHAETSRRRALEELLNELEMLGTFYGGEGLLLIRSKDS